MHHRKITKTVQICGLVLVGSPISPAVEVAETRANSGQCDTQTVDQQLAETFGSVGIFANMRGTPGSIRAVARQLLSAALDAPPVDAACPIGCGATPATIVYKVHPSAYLDQAKQRQVCQDLERETTKTPLRFSEKRFATVDDLNEWIMDFSRGKGPEGKELYRLCSSNCSPRYTFLIKTPDDGAFYVEPEVVCGLARDRSNKRYSLSTSRRSSCTDEAS